MNVTQVQRTHLTLDPKELELLKEVLISEHKQRSEAINQGMIDEEFTAGTCLLEHMLQDLGVEGYEWS